MSIKQKIQLECNEKILLYNGKFKFCNELEQTDILMSSDNKPIKILDIKEEINDLYNVIPIKGESFIIGLNHTLSIRLSNNAVIEYSSKSNTYRIHWIDKGQTKSISFKFNNENKEKTFKKVEQYKSTINVKNQVFKSSLINYIEKSKSWKTYYKLYRTGIEYAKIDIELDPYILGCWLGDGTTSKPQITTNDNEILEYFQEFAKKCNLKLNKVDKYSYDITTGSLYGGYGRNHFTNCLKYYNLLGYKHIPNEYKYNCREIRLGLLAGLIDTDGYLGKNCYEIVQKSKVLADDILYLCRSLGFACYQKQVEKTCTNSSKGRVTGTYHKCSISGEGLEEIPVLLKRKKAHKRQQIKDALNTGFKVEKLEPGKVISLKLEKNSGIILKDFTVTG